MKLRTILTTAAACLILISLSLLTACDEDSLYVPNEPVAVEFLEVDFPDSVLTGAAYQFTVRARLSGVNLVDSQLFSVRGSITIAGAADFAYDFTLVDDGTNGDNIPLDFEFSAVFSNEIFGNHSGSGEVTLTILEQQYAAGDAAQPYTIGEPYTRMFDLAAGQGAAPVLSDFAGIADTLYYDAAESTVITVRAEDPDGLEDIVQVTAEIYLPQQTAPDITVQMLDDGSGDDAQAGDGIYTGVISHADIRSYGDGTYTLLIYALDVSVGRSNEIIHEFTAEGAHIEYPPHIVQVIAPDSLLADGSITQLQVEVADSNGLGDINSVYFTSTRPDGSSSGTRFFMYDDGGTIPRDGVYSGDTTAGDGIYSILIQIPSTAAKGTWIFKFFVTDKVLNRDSQEHPIVVY